MAIRSWAEGPFELIVHGELHLRALSDFDRRVALVSFDNAVEVSITTYLGLHPVQRSGRQYQRTTVESWTNNFYTRLEFLEIECGSRKVTMEYDVPDLLFHHQQRNDQYHTGRLSAPDVALLERMRRASHWVFSLLFDVAEVEQEIEDRIRKMSPLTPNRSEMSDIAIDNAFGPVEIAGIEYRTSEILAVIDPEKYDALTG